MTLRAAVDFDNNDWTAIYADPTDPVNLFGATGVDSSALLRRVSGTGSSAAAQTHARYNNEYTRYGKGYVRWTTGTTAAPILDLGYNGTSYDIGSQAAGRYTVSAWLRLNPLGSSSTDTFRIHLYRNSATLVASGTAAALSVDGWLRMSVSGDLATSGNLFLRVTRASGTAALEVDVTGAMIVAGSIMPEGLNCGAASLLENIGPWVMGMTASSGMNAPYQYVAPLGRATFTLINDDKRFTPEYTAGPLYGDFSGSRLVQIGDQATDRGILWTGWTEDWKPQPGEFGERRCRMTAVDARKFIQTTIPYWPLQEDVDTETETMVAVLMDIVGLPGGGVFVDPSSYENVAFHAVDSVYQAGLGKHWYADSDPENADIVRIIGDIVGGAQGHFWFNRFGQWRVAASTGVIGGGPTMVDLAGMHLNCDYDFDGFVVNKCDVVVHRKRKALAPATTLWELDDTIALAIGASESFRVTFRNTTNDKILVGAENLGTAGTLTIGGPPPTHVTMALTEIGAQSALLTFTNISASAREVATALVDGRRIIALRTVNWTYEDATSQAAFGVRGEVLDFNMTQKVYRAKMVAKWRVLRNKDGGGRVKWVTLHAGKHPDEVWACYVGSWVRVQDDQLDHDAEYFVIGEVHTAERSLLNHTVKLYLEKVYEEDLSIFDPNA